MFETFGGGGIVGGDHNQRVAIGKRVKQMQREPDAILIEAPIDDLPYRALPAAEVDEAMQWAHNNDVAVESFDAAEQGMPSRENYDMDAVRRIVGTDGRPAELREQLRTECPDFSEQWLVRREHEMAENIEYYAASYGTVLVVVGTLHVPALVRLLD